LRHHLQEVGRPGLAEVGGEDGGDVDHGVGGDELEDPAEDAAEGRGHYDGARGGDVGVGAFFGEVEGGVVAWGKGGLVPMFSFLAG